MGCQISLRAALLALALGPVAAFAQSVADLGPRDGWAVHPTGHDHATLVTRTRDAVAHHGLAVVTQAGPTAAARARGVTIPGNTVIGAFNNLYAVRMLELSTHAMIEAPVRLYVTGNRDGSATLAYKLPSAVFAPYGDEGGAELAAAAAELDAVFAAIAAEAAGQ